MWPRTARTLRLPSASRHAPRSGVTARVASQSAAACPPRVDEEDSFALLDRRLMGMTADDHLEARSGRAYVDLIEIMQHVDADFFFQAEDGIRDRSRHSC